MSKQTFNAVTEPAIKSLPLLKRGKIRKLYEVDANHLLIVASDCISAFDVVLPNPIPDKGKILTTVSNFWFQKTAHLTPNHTTTIEPQEVLTTTEATAELCARAVVVKRTAPLPVEAIVRGYLAGSGWTDYQATRMLGGIALPTGLALAQQLPEPLFTPSTKAAVGQHDVNTDFAQIASQIGDETASQVRNQSLAIYQLAANYAAERGIIIADTKFEFGLDKDGQLLLIDEVLTPDSSRFWPIESYRIGQSPPSFDKQFVRDYLETLDWNKSAPGPHLPAELIEGTVARYRQLQDILIDGK